MLEKSELSSAAFASLLSSLWSAAFVLLVALTQVSPEMRRTLEAVAGDSLVDFADVVPNLDRDELLKQILAHAESLRVRRASSFVGEDD
jgi:hypothetical protein